MKQSGYNAEFRAALGGVVNAVTRSGTNKFSGSAGAYYTDNKWLGALRPTLRNRSEGVHRRGPARSPQAHRRGLLDWYLHPISTGPLEGTNTKIRVLQRQSYGFRDRAFFRLKIYALHESKHALVG